MSKFFAFLCIFTAAVLSSAVGCAKSEPAPSAPAATEQPAGDEEVVVEEVTEEVEP